MGERGRVVLTKQGHQQFFYIKTVSALPVRLEFGPSVLAPLVASEVPEDFWIETAARSDWIISADFDRRILVWYAPQEPSWYFEVSADLMTLVAPAWAGWDVRWAHHGLDSVAEQLGLPVEPGRSGVPNLDGVTGRFAAALEEPVNADGTFLITSSTEAQQGSLVGTDRLAGLEWLPFIDPRSIVDLMQPTPPGQYVAVTPNAGLHIDIDDRKLYHWAGRVNRRDHALVSAVHRDGFERIHLAGGLSAHTALLDRPIETSFTREQPQRLLRQANTMLWSLEVEARENAWFARGTLDEPLASDWTTDPSIAKQRLESSLDSVFGDDIEIRLDGTFGGRTAREYAAEMSLKYWR